MSQVIEIDQDIYNTLVNAYGESELKKKLHLIILSGLESLLEKYNRTILEFEEKYGISFNEFENRWNKGDIKNPYSYEIESDFIDWEMLEMEKRDLLKALSRLKRH